MTNQGSSEAARLADALRKFTQTTLRIQQPDGSELTQRPSLRWIQAQTGIAHQRLSEFLRFPERATEAMLGNIQNAIDAPPLDNFWRGSRVAYWDAPAFTSERIRNFQPPPEATAFRIVSDVNASPGREMRSTEWIEGTDRIDELADSVPGGRMAIRRIIFDVGDE